MVEWQLPSSLLWDWKLEVLTFVGHNIKLRKKGLCIIMYKGNEEQLSVWVGSGDRKLCL